LTVTVCIPAYAAGAFLAETVRSVLAQTHRDLKVEVAVDPHPSDGSGEPDDTLAALEPFLADQRIAIHRNPSRLGWDANIQAQLERVATSHFAILPHDDVWDPRYLDAFLEALGARSAASVAYGDLFRFGASEPVQQAMPLPASGSTSDQVMAFLLQGAPGMPWRGVTRASCLAAVGGFPIDGHRGFAVECEYAMALILAGTAVHVPRPLYYKRIHPAGEMTASRERVANLDRARLELAWTNHVERMRSRLIGAMQAWSLPDPHRRLIGFAFDAAMTRRYQAMVSHTLPDDEISKARMSLQMLVRLDAPLAQAVASRVHVALSRDLAARKDREGALSHAVQAVASDPVAPESCLTLARELLVAGRPFEALELVARAERTCPNYLGAARMRKRIFVALGWEPREAEPGLINIAPVPYRE